MNAAPRSPTCSDRAALAGGCSAITPPTASVQTNATARLMASRFHAGGRVPAAPAGSGVARRNYRSSPYHPRGERRSDRRADNAAAIDSIFREVIEALAPLSRQAGSPGEHDAAQWLARRLRAAGCEVQIDEEQFHDGYAQVIGALAAIASVAGGAALARPARRAGAVAAALATAAIVDDISNGPRLFRRAFAQRRTTWNVIASCGEESADLTLVVLAHHDAASTGRDLRPALQAWLAESLPGLIERIDTSPPLWWAMLAGPALVSLGAALRRRGDAADGNRGLPDRRRRVRRRRGGARSRRALTTT